MSTLTTAIILGSIIAVMYRVVKYLEDKVKGQIKC